ncbi:MAG: hypothetical protein WC675_00900 [Patescibacteria group bacterium]|jgi:hypothetical protein
MRKATVLSLVLVVLAGFCLASTKSQQPLTNVSKEAKEAAKKAEETRDLGFDLVKQGPGQAILRIRLGESAPEQMTADLTEMSFNSATYTLVVYPDSEQEGLKKVAMVDFNNFKESDQLKYVYYLTSDLFHQLAEYFDVIHVRTKK